MCVYTPQGVWPLKTNVRCILWCIWIYSWYWRTEHGSSGFASVCNCSVISSASIVAFWLENSRPANIFMISCIFTKRHTGTTLEIIVTVTKYHIVGGMDLDINETSPSSESFISTKQLSLNTTYCVSSPQASNHPCLYLLQWCVCVVRKGILGTQWRDSGPYERKGEGVA